MARARLVAAPALRQPANRVNSRARWYWATSASVRWVLLIGIQVAIWLTRDHPSSLHLILVVITVGVALVHLAVMPQ